jgi:hypothetical protein
MTEQLQTGHKNKGGRRPAGFSGGGGQLQAQPGKNGAGQNLFLHGQGNQEAAGKAAP